MKRIIILFLSIISVIALNAQNQQILNGNFEEWAQFSFTSITGTTTIDTATNWKNYVIYKTPQYSTLIQLAEKTTDRSQGNYAVKIETKSNSGMVIPGLMQLGDLSINGTSVSISGGQAFSGKPQALKAFIKYLPAQNDTAFILSYLTKWNTSTKTTDTVAAAAYPLLDTIANYTEITAPFFYKTADSTCDTINVILTSSSKIHPQIGSTLYADSISLDYEKIPFPTLALPATDTSSTTSFTANWIMSPRTNKYFLDVATDSSFTNYLPGYENKAVTYIPVKDNYTNYIVSYVVNFSTKRDFYYRVRVNYGDTVSINSNVMSVYSFSIPFGIKEIKELKDYRIYNKVLFLYNLPLDSRIQVFTLDGRNLFNILNRNRTINIPFTNSGVYILRVTSKNKIESLKFKID